MNTVQDQIINIIKDTVEKSGCDLVELQCFLRGKHPTIRVFIDRSGGINVNDCQSISRTILDTFDREGLTIANYRLEVSSPGVTRPLKIEKDFVRNIGRNVAVLFKTDTNTKEVEGKIIAAQPVLELKQSDGTIITVSYESLIRGKILLQW